MGQVVAGVLVIIGGVLLIRYAEPLHRIAPDMHLGSPLGLRVMGVGVGVFGVAWTCIAIWQVLAHG